MAGIPATAFLVLALFAGLARAEPPPVIAAASSLRFALADIAQAFKVQTGLSVRLSFGSSGNMARQIAQGAPYQMFLSADETYVRDLAAAGYLIDGGKVYAHGRLALFRAKGSPLRSVKFPGGFRAAFAEPRVHRLALANPAHAPYGRAAKQALVYAGLWDIVEPSLVYGENVSQAAQFAASGSADGGLIAYSLALKLKRSGKGDLSLVPADWHRPLGQRMALVKGAGQTAAKFYAFLSTRKARTLLSQHGFMEAGP
ncbi:MAG TPA: molybdate ABC transporter substrate-binding protein [Rhodospirillales bacterium]|nr:molybdate ABC transporter substrate-binding protein [Rhodospirillales bacterium]